MQLVNVLEVKSNYIISSPLKLTTIQPVPTFICSFILLFKVDLTY